MRNTRFFIIFAMMALFMSLTLSVQAQEQDPMEPWSIFIADTFNGEIIEVRADTTVNVIDLNLPPQTFFGARNVAIDGNNHFAAFCANTLFDETQPPTTVLYVVDLTTGERIVERDYGDVSGCTITLDSMSPDGSNVLVSLFDHYPGDGIVDSDPVWTLAVVDTATGETIQQLTSDDDIVQAQNTGVENTLATFPYVQNYDGDIVVVAMLPYGTEGRPVTPAFAWNRSENTFTPAAEFWGRINVSYLEATGEAAWVENDPNLPAADPGGPMISGNTVKVMNADGTISTVFTNPEYVIFDTEFFANGEWLGISMLEPFDFENPGNPQEVVWVGLARNSENEILFSNEGFAELTAVPGGFARFTGSMSEDGSMISVNLTAANVSGSKFNLWNYEGENRGFVWGIVKSPAPMPQGDLPPFTPTN